jgi:hypothetical protein
MTFWTPNFNPRLKDSMKCTYVCISPIFIILTFEMNLLKVIGGYLEAFLGFPILERQKQINDRCRDLCEYQIKKVNTLESNIKDRFHDLDVRIRFSKHPL